MGTNEDPSIQMKFHVRESSIAYDIRRERSRLTKSARGSPGVLETSRECTRVAENERELPRVHDSRVDARDLQSLNSRQLFEMLRRWAWCLAFLKTSGNISARKLFYEHIVSLNTENYTKLRDILG